MVSAKWRRYDGLGVAGAGSQGSPPTSPYPGSACRSGALEGRHLQGLTARSMTTLGLKN